MPLPDLADLALKAATDAFAVPATYKTLVSAPGGPDLAVRGVFDAAHEVVELGDEGAAASSTAPVLGIRLADFAGVTPAQGDEVVIDANTYEVYDTQPDGPGVGMQLLLKRKTA